MHRRTLLRNTAIGSTFLLAGCSGSTDTDEQQESRFEHPPGECTLGESHGCSDSLNIHTAKGGQRGNNLYTYGRVENISGKPLEDITMIAKFKDESGALIKNSRKRLTTFFHGDVWHYEIPFSGSLNEARAVSSFNVDAEVGENLDPEVALTNPESCDGVKDWWCDGNAKITSLNEGFVTRETGKEKWMVWGDVKNISESEIESVSISGHYREGNDIYETYSFGLFKGKTGLNIQAGETDTFRLIFGDEKPSRGSVSVYMYNLRK